MPPIREDAVEKIRRDHEYMLELIRRIISACTESNAVENCNSCELNQRQVCRGNIEQQIKAFVDVTLKHNLIESLFMEEGVPQAHRVAHNKAHMDIAEQMKSIRVVLSEDGNCVLAIEGIDQIFRTLSTHFTEFDQQLECYLLAPI